MLLLPALLTSCVCSAGAVAAPTVPGFELALTDSGFAYAIKVAVPIIEHDIQTATIPDISIDADTPVGHVTFQLSSITPTAINLGSPVVASQTTGLVLSISGASIALSAHWHYRENSWCAARAPPTARITHTTARTRNNAHATTLRLVVHFHFHF